MKTYRQRKDGINSRKDSVWVYKPAQTITIPDRIVSEDGEFCAYVDIPNFNEWFEEILENENV